MSLRFRHVALRVITNDGPYGAAVDFDDGLVVIRANNSLGKSTLLQSMFYALGLEGMFGPSHEPPMPHAVKEYLKTDQGERREVLESSVVVEIEGDQGGTVSLRRSIVGGSDQRLIETWDGQIISSPESAGRKKDFYVRLPGAAQRERGFHRYLEALLGWSLPDVPRYQMDEGKLYLEAMFPLLYVEQKRGWSTVGADFPSYLRIRDVAARATEYLLDLQAGELAKQRMRISDAEKGLREEWSSQVVQISNLAEVVHGIVEALPQNPTSDWPLALNPKIIIPSSEGDWQPLTEIVSNLKLRLNELNQIEVPATGEVLADVRNRLKEAQQELLGKERAARHFAEEIAVEKDQLRAIEAQITALEEDLARNQDLVRLRELGSSESWKLHTDLCPTCLQDVPDALIPLEKEEHLLTVSDQIEYIRQQREVFRALQIESAKSIEAKMKRLHHLDASLDDLRGKIRSLKQTLAADSRTPSIEAVQQRVALADKIQELSRVAAMFQDEVAGFAQLSEQWVEVQREKSSLPADRFSAEDKDKLGQLEQNFRENLSTFELRSVEPNSVDISLDTYRPIHRGFDLQFDFSASDTIRTIWAYRLALLEIAREYRTNHPGLVVFDEPRQHNTDSSSIRRFFEKAAEAGEFGQQIIVATSGEEEQIRNLLDGVPHQYWTFDSFVVASR